MTNRVIAIGDVHGCIETLKALITKIQPTSKDKIIMLGDYFDRGPSSGEVYKYLKVMDSVWNCTFLKGNHEDMMVKAIRNQDDSLWMYNGGFYTKQSFTISDVKIGEVVNWADNLPLWTETKNHYFVHAGLPYGNPEDNDEKDMLWDREHINSPVNAADKRVVFGHTPNHKPYFTKSGNICIDSGCVFGYSLSAMIIADNDNDELASKIISVPCVDKKIISW